VEHLGVNEDPETPRTPGTDGVKLKATILIIHESVEERRDLRKILEAREYAVVEAGTGGEGFELAHTAGPDTILLGVDLPGMGGFEVCRHLKVDKDTSFVPVIFVGTKNLDEKTRIEALEIGANDFITKPSSEAELAARVAVNVRIKKAEDALRERAVTDDLTHLFNRRFLFERFEEEFSRARRHGTSIGCLIVDIDFFKRVNDTHGHLAGDVVLRELAALMQEFARSEDIVGRYGGEEFLIVLPHTDLKGAKAFAERLCAKVKNSRFEYGGKAIRITVSGGISCSPECGAETPDDMVKIADDALLAAKRTGRDQVVTGWGCQEAEEEDEGRGDHERDSGEHERAR
jgi:diguanylate cyclase (GGDEF)-like protein